MGRIFKQTCVLFIVALGIVYGTGATAQTQIARLNVRLITQTTPTPEIDERIFEPVTPPPSKPTPQSTAAPLPQGQVNHWGILLPFTRLLSSDMQANIGDVKLIEGRVKAAIEQQTGLTLFNVSYSSKVTSFSREAIDSPFGAAPTPKTILTRLCRQHRLHGLIFGQLQEDHLEQALFVALRVFQAKNQTITSFYEKIPIASPRVKQAVEQSIAQFNTQISAAILTAGETFDTWRDMYMMALNNDFYCVPNLNNALVQKALNDLARDRGVQKNEVLAALKPTSRAWTVKWTNPPMNNGLTDPDYLQLTIHQSKRNNSSPFKMALYAYHYPITTPVSYAEAEKLAHKLNVAQYNGFSDWRLPTIKELCSIFQYEQPHPQTVLPTLFATEHYFWSSTPDNTGGHWVCNAKVHISLGKQKSFFLLVVRTP